MVRILTPDQFQTSPKKNGGGETHEYPSCASAFLGPQSVSLDQGVYGFKELSHDGDDGDLRGFPSERRWAYFALRSRLNRMAAKVGM